MSPLKESPIMMKTYNYTYFFLQHETYTMLHDILDSITGISIQYVFFETLNNSFQRLVGRKIQLKVIENIKKKTEFRSQPSVKRD